MKVAKPTEQDIDAAGEAMCLLNEVGSGYFPAREGDVDPPTFFDKEDPEHLRRFYDLMQSTMTKAPGWQGRVIGGMCYVIMYDKNQIVDPASDTIDLHPRFQAVAAQGRPEGGVSG